MTNKRLRIEEGSIGYITAGNKGPAVILVHGNSQSALSFRYQLESPLSEKYRLFALDLPGHGRSSPAKNPEKTYSLPGYARILSLFTESLGLEDAVLVGTSLGGHIILEASSKLKGAKGFLINGTPPLGKPPAMDRAFLSNIEYATKADLTEDEVRSFTSVMFRAGVEELPESFMESIRTTDDRARQHLGSSLINGEYKDELAIVKDLSTPLAVLHGEEDRIVSSAYLESIEMPTLWRGKVRYIAGAGHCPQWETPGEFNSLLDEFTEEISK